MKVAILSSAEKYHTYSFTCFTIFMSVAFQGQPHKPFREKSKFHLDTFWALLNIVVSQASREPVFITGWVQLHRDQGFSLFWVTSFSWPSLGHGVLFVPTIFLGLWNFLPCCPPSQDEPLCPGCNCPFFILHQSVLFCSYSLLYSFLDNTVSGTLFLTLVFGLGLLCESHVRAGLSISCPTQREMTPGLWNAF